MIVNYARNDSGLYYKTTIVARYELKLRAKLKRNLWSYNHNLWSQVMLQIEVLFTIVKHFIVQATALLPLFTSTLGPYSQHFIFFVTYRLAE